MFSALAGMYMAAKAQLTHLQLNHQKKRSSQTSELIYRKDVDKKEKKQQFEKKLLPESGYMTVEEYEEKSRAKTRKEITAEILDKPDMPKDKNYIYVPQHIFKLVRYNDPVGSPELSLPRRLMYDRQVNAQGIVSGDYKKLVYPAIYYYAEKNCINSDLFLINLDETFADPLERVKRANILNKEKAPLLSTNNDIRQAVFRTLTPIDFSSDNSKLLIKEKIGSRNDGIWKTDVWIYDFDKKQAKNLTALRDAITYYWNKNSKLELNDKRWDVYPVGFDANNAERVIVCAYAYANGAPKFLGTWSVDVNNESTKLESLSGAGIPVSVVGFKISKEHDILPMSELEFDAKQTAKELKLKAKKEKKLKKQEERKQRQEFKEELYNMDVEMLNKVRSENNTNKKLRYKKTTGQVTDNSGDTELQELKNNFNNSKIQFLQRENQEGYKQESLPDLDRILNQFRRDSGIDSMNDYDNFENEFDELDEIEE